MQASTVVELAGGHIITIANDRCVDENRAKAHFVPSAAFLPVKPMPVSSFKIPLPLPINKMGMYSLYRTPLRQRIDNTHWDTTMPDYL